MKKKIFAIIPFIVLTFFSCSNLIQNGKGTLVIRNEDSVASIRSVYVSSEKDGTKSGYYLVYSGDIKPGESYFISLDSGRYSVKVQTGIQFIGNTYIYNTAETGYNIYKKLNEDTSLYVIYDGNGLYFE